MLLACAQDGQQRPGLAAAQHAVNVNLVIDYVGASVGIAVLLMLARSLNRGRDRARIAFAADFGAITLSMLIAIGQGSAVSHRPT